MIITFIDRNPARNKDGGIPVRTVGIAQETGPVRIIYDHLWHLGNAGAKLLATYVVGTADDGRDDGWTIADGRVPQLYSDMEFS